MEKKNFERLVHTWMEKKVKKPQYIIRRKEKGRRDWKYSQIIALGHVRGYYLHRLRVQLFPFNTIIQDLGPRFRLAFSLALYKFIVWATWAWIHSCSGFKSNLVLTVNFLFVFLIKIDEIIFFIISDVALKKCQIIFLIIF